MSWFGRFGARLQKAKESFAQVLALGSSERPLDAEFWEEFEEALLQADVGFATTERILAGLRIVARQEAWSSAGPLVARFRRDVQRFLDLPNGEIRVDRHPTVVLVVGVNGSGKTTSIGKLAARFVARGQRVLLVAGDTFRAAAAEQLTIWGERSGSEVLRGLENADPSAVVFDGITAGIARGVDLILVDTAGRLQTKNNLMEELKKIRRVTERALGRPPDRTLLVLDATTGQNAISQATLFHEATPLDGIIMTKLDSSAKGGVLLGVVERIERPIAYVGLGEGVEQLEAFDATGYVEALFGEEIVKTP
ncbi:MAG TPA: signal recognition particle-docking protein FtsY [Candidatus Dormibacteraeota bacterium]|nr:signal recognition particle-docking protein FtsY [Candidatus Dormibacteraeota bacterium]